MTYKKSNPSGRKSVSCSIPVGKNQLPTAKAEHSSKSERGIGILKKNNRYNNPPAAAAAKNREDDSAEAGGKENKANSRVISESGRRFKTPQPWRCGMPQPKRKVAKADVHHPSPLRQKPCLVPARSRKVQEYMEKKSERKKEWQQMEAESKEALRLRQEKAKALEKKGKDRLIMEAEQKRRKGPFKRPEWVSVFSYRPTVNIGPWTTMPKAEVAFPLPKLQTTEHICPHYRDFENIIQEPKGHFQQKHLTQCQPAWACPSEIHSDSQSQDLSSFSYPKGYVKKNHICECSSTQECMDQPKGQRSKLQIRKCLPPSSKAPSRDSVSSDITNSQKVQLRSSSTVGRHSKVSPHSLKRIATTSSHLRSSIEKRREQVSRPEVNNALRGNDCQGSQKVSRVASRRSVLKGQTQAVKAASSCQPPRKLLKAKDKVISRGSYETSGLGLKRFNDLLGEESSRVPMPAFGRKNAVENRKVNALPKTSSRCNMKNDTMQRDTEEDTYNQVRDQGKSIELVKEPTNSLGKCVAQQLAGHLSAANNIANWKNNALYSPKNSNRASSNGLPMSNDPLKLILVAEPRQLLERNCSPVDSDWKGSYSETDWKNCSSLDEEHQRRGDIFSSSPQPTQHSLDFNENSSGWKPSEEEAPSIKVPLPIDGEKLGVINLYLKHQHSRQLGESVLARESRLFGLDGSRIHPFEGQDPWLHSRDDQTFAFSEIQDSFGLLLTTIQGQNQSDRTLSGNKDFKSECLSAERKMCHPFHNISREGNQESETKLSSKEQLTNQKDKRIKRKLRKSSTKHGVLKLHQIAENVISSQVLNEKKTNIIENSRSNKGDHIKRTSKQVKVQTFLEDSGYHCSSGSSEEGQRKMSTVKKDWLARYEMGCRDCHDDDNHFKWDKIALEEVHKLDNEIVQRKARMVQNPLFIHITSLRDCGSTLAILDTSVNSKCDFSANVNLLGKENTVLSSPSDCIPMTSSPCMNATVLHSGSSQAFQTHSTCGPEVDHTPSWAMLNELLLSSPVKHDSESSHIVLEMARGVHSSFKSEMSRGVHSSFKSEMSRGVHSSIKSEQHADKCYIGKSKLTTLKVGLTDSLKDFNGTVSEVTSHIFEEEEEVDIVPDVTVEDVNVLSSHSPCQDIDNSRDESNSVHVDYSSENFDGTVSIDICKGNEDRKFSSKVTSEDDDAIPTRSQYQEVGSLLMSEHSKIVPFTHIQECHQTCKKDRSTSDGIGESYETKEDVSEDIVFNGEEDRREHRERNCCHICSQIKVVSQPSWTEVQDGHVKKSNLNKQVDFNPQDCAPLQYSAMNDDDDEYGDFNPHSTNLVCYSELQGKDLMSSGILNLEEENDFFSIDTARLEKGTLIEDFNFKETVVGVNLLQYGKESADCIKESNQERISTSTEPNPGSLLNEYPLRNPQRASEYHSIKLWFEELVLDLNWAACEPKQSRSPISITPVDTSRKSSRITNTCEKNECKNSVDFIADKLLDNILENELPDFTSHAQSLPVYNLNSQIKVAVEGSNDFVGACCRSRNESEFGEPSKNEMAFSHGKQTLALPSTDSGPLEVEIDTSPFVTKFILTRRSIEKYSRYIYPHIMIGHRRTPATDPVFVRPYVNKVFEVSGLLKDPSSLIWSEDDWALLSNVHSLVQKSLLGITEENERNYDTCTKLLFNAVNEYLRKHSLRASPLDLKCTKPLLFAQEMVQDVVNDICGIINLGGSSSGLDLERLLEKSLDDGWNNHSRETVETCTQMAEALLDDLVGGLVNEFDNYLRDSN